MSFPPKNTAASANGCWQTGVADANDFLEPQPASDEDILLVHTPEYVDKLKTGTLSSREELELEVPFSRELVEAFWLAAGGSIAGGATSFGRRCCRSTSVADFITPSRIMAKGSA